MSIWARTLIVVILLGLILLTAAFLLTAWEYAGMEKVLANRQDELTTLLSNSITISGKSLSVFTYDYTYWDDLVAFMQTGDPVWAKENLLGAMETYDASVLWIYRTDYALHYSITHDGEPAPEIPGITRLLPGLFDRQRLSHFFFQAPQGLLEVRGASIHPTADTDRITPPHGYFIAGRYWNSEYLSALTGLTGGHIEVSQQPPPATVRSRHSFKNGEYVIRKELPGMDGLPVAWAIAHIPSPAAANYIYTLWWSIGLNVSLLTAIVGLVALILYFWVVRPLRLIRTTLNTGNTLPLTRIEWISTEFTDIAEVIRRSFQQQHQLQNEILERTQTETRLAQRNEFIESILDNLPLGCNVFRASDLSLQFMNRKYAEHCGWPLEALTSFDDFVQKVLPSGRHNEIVQEMPKKLETLEYEGLKLDDIEIRTQAGEQRFISGQVFKIPGQDLVITLLDNVTDKLKTKEALLLNEARMEALLKLNQMSFDSVNAIAEHAMEEAIQLTQSTLGFVAFANEEETVLTMHAWSRRAMEECRIDDSPRVFPLETTGLWGEAVRQRRPIVVNDYVAPNALKRGYPEGHVELTRVISLPIFDAGHIVVVAGLANKPHDYNDSDVRQLTLLMEGMWNIIQRKRTEDQIKEQSSLNAALADLYEPLTSPSTSIQETARLILQYAQTLTQSPDGFVSEVHPASGMILDHAMTVLFEKNSLRTFEKMKYALSSGFDETCYGKQNLSASNHSGFFKNDLTVLADALEPSPLQPQLQRLLTVPIILEAKHAGTITLVNKNQDYTDSDLHAVQRLAQFFALTIQHKRVETDLRRLAAAIEQAAEIVVIAGVQGEVQYVNPAFEYTTGHARGDVLGESLCSVLSGDASGRPALWKDIQNAIRQSRGWSGLLTNRKQNSSILRLETTVFPVHADFGAMTNLVAISRDITRETDLQEQLRQSQKMEAVGQLAGGVAHDFNNLLQVITGYTDLALASVESESLVAQNLQEILNTSERARALVNQLLLFSRRQVQQPKNINLSETVESAMKLLGRVIGEHIERVFNGCDAVKPVCADPNQVLQVLMNLCVNAQDAMPKGGRLTISVYGAEFDEAFCAAHPWAKEGEFAALSVNDTGLGMPDEIKAHIFEPFFSTKEVGKGTGLGLATVYGIVKQHDGLLHVESEPGKGSTFFVYLPVAQDTCVDPAGMSESLGSLDGKGETILLAEDEENVRYLTTRMLRSKGYHPIMARDGEEAIQLLHQHIGELKLVVVDAVMPKKSGRDVYDAVRASRADLPVLFVSGYSYDVLEGGSKLVNAALLPKPFRPQELLLRIRDMLDHTPAPPTE